jgi:hypothetical protein
MGRVLGGKSRKEDAVADETDRRDDRDQPAHEAPNDEPEEELVEAESDGEPEARPGRAGARDLADALGQGGGAAELAAEMRKGRPDPGAPGQEATPPPAVSDGPGTRPAGGAESRRRRRAPTGHARAATHLSYKRFAWLPALAMGLICVAVGIYCAVRGLSVDVPEPPGQVLEGPNGRLWVIDAQATDITWEGGEPRGKLEGGWDVVGKLPAERPDFRRYLDQKKVATQWLIFAVAFVPVGAVLAFFGLWMRRDVKLVAAQAAETEAAAAEGAAAGPADVEQTRDRAGDLAFTDGGVAEVVSEPDEEPPDAPEDEAQKPPA